MGLDQRVIVVFPRQSISLALLYGTVWIAWTSVSSGIFQKQSIVCCILHVLEDFYDCFFCGMFSPYMFQYLSVNATLVVVIK